MPPSRTGVVLSSSSCRRVARKHLVAFHKASEANTPPQGGIVSSLPDDQHMARVTIPEEQWLEFRAMAIRERRSVAAYLGRLGEKEIGRMAQVEERRSQRELDKTNNPPTHVLAPKIEVDDDWVPPWET